MKKLSIVLGAVLFACLTTTVPLLAQDISLNGSILDSTGGALPGVTVTASHLDTGNTYFGVTDGTGSYRIGALRPGDYTVEAQLSGFVTIVQQEVALTVGQTGTLDFNMSVAAVEETVTVTGAAPLVDTQTSRMGGAISPLQMEELPINGRDWLQLTMMAPGSRVNATASSLTPSGRWATDFQVNLDGQPVSQSFSVAGLGQPRFSRDAIAEFEVVSSRFDATQGRSTGIQVNAVTKSGSNQLSATASGFFRHDSMNAKDFFADKVLPYKNNQLSFTAGGPIAEDRVHFFAYFEDEGEPKSFFFNSIIPEWNDLGNGPDGNGFQYTDKSRLFGARIDAQLTRNTRLMGRVNGFNSETLRRPERSLSHHPSTLLDQQYASLQTFFSLTRASGTTVNEIKFGTNAFKWTTQSFWGIRAPQVNLQGVTVGPSFVTNGLDQTQQIPTLRNDFTSLKGNHTFKIGGEYMLPSYYAYVPAERDGFLIAQEGPPPANVASLFPAIDPSTWNLQPLSPITLRFAQSSGRYDTHAGTCDNPGPAPGVPDPENGCWRTKAAYSWWLQDDWQATDNLTLNLGLRWDFAEDIMGNDIDYTGLRAPQYANDPIRKPVPQFTNMYQPRVGFAYSLNDDRTVIRGGAGLYFSGVNDVSAIHTEFPLAFLTFENRNDGRADFASDPFQAFPGGVRPTHQEVIDGANAGIYKLDLSSYGPVTLDDAKVRYSTQFTLGFQHQLNDTASFQMDYVTIRSRNGVYSKNANLTYDPVTGINRPYSDASTRRWPDVGLVRIYDHGKATDYQGVEMALTKRYSDGFQVSGTYTLGKARSCSPPGDPTNDSWTGPRDLGLDCWYSSISDGGPPHQVHRAVINGIVDVGAGFQLSGLYFYGSGQRYDSYNVSDLRDTGGFFSGWPASAQRLEADGTIADHANIRGDKINRVDIRLMRRFNLGRATVDGILETFNLFNYKNYGKYQSCTCSSKYATPSYNPDVAYWPRIIQLAFRVGF